MYGLLRHICFLVNPRINPIILSGALLISVFSVFGQIGLDIGQLSVRNFTSKNYNASAQNWDVTQDLKGLMYFANAEGILIYDGLEWNIVKTSNESGIRSLDVSPSGKVYVGAVGDFGYLSADKFGKQVFISLQRRYNLDPEEIQDVFHVNAFDEGVYFMTKRNVYFYDGKSLKIWESESSFQSAYSINET